MKKNQQSVEGEASEREEGNLGVWGEFRAKRKTVSGRKRWSTVSHGAEYAKQMST